MLLETLCNASGVSGDEQRIRKLIYDDINSYADELRADSMGNLIAFRRGKSSDRRLMLSAHMDEVGFIISGYTEKGYLKFRTVGGIDTRVIISKRVRIADRINGVIGIKAIHLLTKDERESVPKVKDLFIDIGAKTEEEAKKYVKIGDYASFCTQYSDFGTDKIKAKAIDDRAGCYILTELIKEQPEYDTYFCFLTQEEVGLRGARTAAFGIMPDAALVLEATTCSDVHGTKPHEIVTKCGGGAVISFMDGTTIVNREFYRGLAAAAEAEGIPVQYKMTTAGGNDAGAIHVTRTGIKTVSVSVPARYIHSPVSVASKSDIRACTDIARLFVKKGGEF